MGFREGGVNMSFSIFVIVNAMLQIDAIVKIVTVLTRRTAHAPAKAFVPL